MESTPTTMQADRILDLGEKGCSRLLEDIADEMQGMAAGQALLVIANDPAAPLDIKVWSRTTGNPLLKLDLATGQFLLQKKQA
jgi:TusA-related sulfurtransferase